MDGALLSFLGREREERVRIGERACVLRLLSARETLALRREIAQEDCRDEEEQALRANAALLRRSLRENENGAAGIAAAKERDAFTLSREREMRETEAFSQSLERDARRYDGGFLFY